jgi:hypothetical protein
MNPQVWRLRMSKSYVKFVFQPSSFFVPVITVIKYKGRPQDCVVLNPWIYEFASFVMLDWARLDLGSPDVPPGIPGHWGAGQLGTVRELSPPKDLAINKTFLCSVITIVSSPIAILQAVIYFYGIVI